MRVKREVLLRCFLKEYGFVDPCKPAKKTLFSAISPKEFFFPKEVFYPIHLAAHLGDAELVRTLLARGADPEQKSSKGQTPSDIARAANRDGSHETWTFCFFLIFPENSQGDYGDLLGMVSFCSLFEIFPKQIQGYGSDAAGWQSCRPEFSGCARTDGTLMPFSHPGYPYQISAWHSLVSAACE